jgi:signal transduction histidine kinase
LKKQIGCKITYPVESLHVYQIVTNLVRNAAEAINGEGAVTVILNKVKPSFDSLLVDFEATEWVNIAVEDNGPGIEQSIADKVFEPFFTTKSEKNGSGLGLSVVLGLVSNYGGQVAFHTLHPHGTRFDIFLPVNNDIIIM